jgi:hypothetical protein
MARADGVLTDSELEAAAHLRQALGIDQCGPAGPARGAPAELTELKPKSRDEAKVLYRALVSAALVDGHIDAEERRLLLATAAHLKLPQEEAQPSSRDEGRVRQAAAGVTGLGAASAPRSVAVGRVALFSSRHSRRVVLVASRRELPASAPAPHRVGRSRRCASGPIDRKIPRHGGRALPLPHYPTTQGAP